MFWDLYCAAPERRDMSDMAPATQEAKMFADNVSTLNHHFKNATN